MGEYREESYFRVAQALAFPVNDIGVAFGSIVGAEVLEATGPDGSMLPALRPPGVMVAVGGTIGARRPTRRISFTDEQILAQGCGLRAGRCVFCVALARLIFRPVLPSVCLLMRS